MTTFYDPEAPQWVRDLARVCVHEHAHAAVARSLGIPGKVAVWPANEPSDDCMSYRGQFTLFRPTKRLRDRRVIGLAGVVAESILVGDTDLQLPDAADIWLENWTDQDSLSASDAALIGTVRLPAVRACVSALRKVWPEVLEEAGLQYRSEVRVLAASLK